MYDSTTEVMTCEYCLFIGKTNAFTKGSQKRRMDSLTEHLFTQDHENTVNYLTGKAMDKYVKKNLEGDDKRNAVLI